MKIIKHSKERNIVFKMLAVFIAVSFLVTNIGISDVFALQPELSRTYATFDVNYQVRHVIPAADLVKEFIETTLAHKCGSIDQASLKILADCPMFEPGEKDPKDDFIEEIYIKAKGQIRDLGLDIHDFRVIRDDTGKIAELLIELDIEKVEGGNITLRYYNPKSPVSFVSEDYVSASELGRDDVYPGKQLAVSLLYSKPLHDVISANKTDDNLKDIPQAEIAPQITPETQTEPAKEPEAPEEDSDKIETSGLRDMIYYASTVSVFTAIAFLLGYVSQDVAAIMIAVTTIHNLVNFHTYRAIKEKLNGQDIPIAKYDKKIGKIYYLRKNWQQYEGEARYILDESNSMLRKLDPLSRATIKMHEMIHGSGISNELFTYTLTPFISLPYYACNAVNKDIKETSSKIKKQILRGEALEQRLALSGITGNAPVYVIGDYGALYEPGFVEKAPEFTAPEGDSHIPLGITETSSDINHETDADGNTTYYLSYHDNGKVKEQTKYYAEGLTNIYSEFDENGNLVMQQIRYGTLDGYIIFDTIYFGDQSSDSGFDKALELYLSSDYENRSTWERPLRPNEINPPGGMRVIQPNEALYGKTLILSVVDPFTGEITYYTVTYMWPTILPESPNTSGSPWHPIRSYYPHRNILIQAFNKSTPYYLAEMGGPEAGLGNFFDWMESVPEKEGTPVVKEGEEDMYIIEVYDGNGNLIEKTQIIKAEAPKTEKALGEASTRIPKAPMGITVTAYPNGRVESRTYSPPDVSDNVVYRHYINEDWQGQGEGRIDIEVSDEADTDGAVAYKLEYDPVTGDLAKKIGYPDLASLQADQNKMLEITYYPVDPAFPDRHLIESKSFTTPDIKENIYYHYMNEDFQGRGYGRIDIVMRLTPDVENGMAYHFTYFYGTEDELYKDVYQTADFSNPNDPQFSNILVRYEYDQMGTVVFKVYRTPTKIYKDGVLVEEYGFSGPTVDTGYHIYYLEYHANGQVKAQTKYYLEGWTNIYSEFDEYGNLVLQQIRYGTLTDYIIFDTITSFETGGGGSFDFDQAIALYLTNNSSWGNKFYVTIYHGKSIERWELTTNPAGPWVRTPAYVRNALKMSSPLHGRLLSRIKLEPEGGLPVPAEGGGAGGLGGGGFYFTLIKHPWDQSDRIFHKMTPYNKAEWKGDDPKEGEGFFDWMEEGEKVINIEIYDTEGNLIEKVQIKLKYEEEPKEEKDVSPEGPSKEEKTPEETPVKTPGIPMGIKIEKDTEEDAYNRALGFYLSAMYEFGSSFGTLAYMQELISSWEYLPPPWMKNTVGFTKVATFPAQAEMDSGGFMFINPFTGEKFYSSCTYVWSGLHGNPYRNAPYSSGPFQLIPYPFNHRSQIHQRTTPHDLAEFYGEEPNEGEGFFDWMETEPEERKGTPEEKQGEEKEPTSEQGLGEAITESHEKHHSEDTEKLPANVEDAIDSIMEQGVDAVEEKVPVGEGEDTEAQKKREEQITSQSEEDPSERSALSFLDIEELAEDAAKLILAAGAVAGTVLLAQGEEDSGGDVKKRLKENLDTFGGFSEESDEPMIIKVPIKLLENVKDKQIMEWVIALTEANKYVELYRVAPDADHPGKETYEKITDNDKYTKYGLPTPDRWSHITSSRENTITLLAVEQDVEQDADRQALKRQMQNRIDNSGFQDSVIVPLGLNGDQTGLVRSITLGLGVVRMIRSPQESEEIKQEVAKTYYAFIKTYGDRTKYYREDFDAYINTFTSGEFDLNDVVNGLMALVKSLPHAGRISVDLYNFAAQLVRQAA